MHLSLPNCGCCNVSRLRMMRLQILCDLLAVVNAVLSNNSLIVFRLRSFLPSLLPSFLPPSLPSFLPSFLPSLPPSLLPSFPPSFLPSLVPLLFIFLILFNPIQFFCDAIVFDANYFFWCLSLFELGGPVLQQGSCSIRFHGWICNTINTNFTFGEWHYYTRKAQPSTCICACSDVLQEIGTQCRIQQHSTTQLPSPLGVPDGTTGRLGSGMVASTRGHCVDDADDDQWCLRWWWTKIQHE